MKVTIKKTIDPDGHWFKVYTGDVLTNCFYFDPIAPEGTLNCEKRNYQRALNKAKEIETTVTHEEIVYTTKEDISEPLQTLNELQP